MSRLNVLILFLLSLQVFVACFEHHNCIHDVLVAEEAKLGKRHEKRVNLPRQNVKAPIRMRIDTSSFDLDPAICRSVGQVVLTDSIGTQYRCTANDIMTPEKEAFLENRIIPESIAKFASLLNVLSVSEPLKLYDDTCGCGGRQPAKVNTTYQNDGAADTDIVLFMTARPTFNGTIAWACPCMFEGSGRPIAGFINWGPNAIDQTAISYPGQFGVGIHEITHALGFTSGSYANYASGPNIVQTVTRTDDGLSHNVSIIGTPKVQQAIRAHFNCPTMDGMELENGGGSGTAGSHWEKRLASNEYMTGTSSFDPVFSPITLALLEDSGWYFPNYSNASPLLWGKNAGCNFVNLRCDDWPRPYSCDANLMNADIDCTFDYRKKGVCNIRNATTIPTDPWYSYYPNKRAFGSDLYSDYCGFIAAQKTWDCTVPENSNITFSRQAYGEKYCPTCRCMRTMNKDKLRTPSCQNFTCVGPTLKVQIGYVWYDCDANDKQITITSGYDGGYYVCPPDAATQCQGVPVDPTNVWPTFVGVTPNAGAPGTNVTITVTNLLDVANVAFGPQHGCYEPSIVTSVTGTQTTITCLIGQLKSAVIILEENKDVDVTVVDSQGRSATGFKAYRLNTSDAGMMGWNGWMIVIALLGFAIKM